MFAKISYWNSKIWKFGKKNPKMQKPKGELESAIGRKWWSLHEALTDWATLHSNENV